MWGGKGSATHWTPMEFQSSHFPSLPFSFLDWIRWGIIQQPNSVVSITTTQCTYFTFSFWSLNHASKLGLEEVSAGFFCFFFSFPPKDVYKVGDIYTHSVKNWSEFTNGSITGNHSQAGLLYRGVKAATVRQKSSQPVANVLGIHGMCWTAWNAELGTVQHRATSTETGSSDCKERLVSIFPPLH